MVNRSVIGTVIFAVVCLGALALGGWMRSIYAPEWRQVDLSSTKTAEGRPWAVEADCYSQLARVQRILHGDGLIQNHFKVENWPEGLTPSTTAPFDYAILLLYAPLTLFTQYPLDWAGALISPLLWVALVLFWIFFRSRQFNRIGRALLVIGSATIPALIWATACGRPRHQSLILFLIALGLTAEYERWEIGIPAKRFWNTFAGIIWGLACWTSLYEPTLVVVLLVIYNLIVRRRENLAFLASLGVVLIAALLIEGVHIFAPPDEYRIALGNWLETISEWRGFTFAHLIQQMTLVLALLPVIAWGLCARDGDNRTDIFLILLAALLIIITAFQGRWIYYASLAELFLVARYCQLQPIRWWRAAVVIVFFLGLEDADQQIATKGEMPPNQPSPQLATISRAISQPGGIMAPWWLSPGLLYFSGQPIVTGSSHCGISGIVAGARFFNTTSWIEANRILQERQVRWIMVYDDPDYVYPLLNTSRGILGLPSYSADDKNEADQTVAQILISDHFVPTSLRLRAVTPHLKLYEYAPSATP